jgi:hypothetical protein
MSDGPNGPNAPDLQQQIAELRQQRFQDQMELARLQVYAAHPHLRDLGLLEDFQGGPEQIATYGRKLAERIPAPPPAPAPLTQAPGGQVPPVQPAPPVQPPESATLPAPTQQDILTQQSADVARAADIYTRIRESMQDGVARVTRADAQWFSQWAPPHEVEVTEGHMGVSSGFVSAVKRMGAQGR